MRKITLPHPENYSLLTELAFWRSTLYFMPMNSHELHIVRQIVLLTAVAVTLGFLYG
jgi:hypothetical protein